MFACATLPAEPTSPGVARQFIRITLTGWSLSAYEDVACLLVSELVTNAVLHAHSPSDVSVRYEDGVLHISVEDESEQRVRPRTYSRDAGTGRGLMLVQALAAAWGSSGTERGKQVWFELDHAALTRGAG